MKNVLDKTNINNKLPWPIDLALFFLQRKICSRKIPLLASFKVSYRCNLACLACPFHLRQVYAQKPIRWNNAIKALDTLRRLGTRIIVFEGGEPLLWRDGSHSLTDLIAYARKHFLRVALTTNGTLPLDVPADTLWVSLDGMKTTHDELRSDSFDRIESNLKATRHPRVFVHCTLNRRNFHEAEAVARWVQAMPAVKGMTFQFFYPYHQGEDDLALSLDDRRKVIGKLLRLKSQGYPILNSAGRLRAMVDNRWRCHDDILINVDPDRKSVV